MLSELELAPSAMLCVVRASEVVLAAGAAEVPALAVDEDEPALAE